MGEREKAAGRWQEVSWSQSTDLSDFIKQSCLNERFKIVIEPQGQIQLEDGKGQEGKVNSDGDGDRDAGKHESGKEGNQGMTLEVLIPSFASRTTYIRKRLLALTKELDTMTKKKKKWVVLLDCRPLNIMPRGAIRVQSLISESIFSLTRVPSD